MSKAEERFYDAVIPRKGKKSSLFDYGKFGKNNKQVTSAKNAVKANTDNTFQKPKP
jgi:hypothetical protein